MNNLIEISEIKNGADRQKSAYKSIIYDFSGEITVKKSGKTYVLRKNEYLVLPRESEFTVSCKEDDEVYLIITDGLEFCGEDRIFTDENKAIGCALKYAKYYYDSEKSNGKNVSEAFVNAICAIIGGFFASGKNATVERIKNKITVSYSDPDFDLPSYLNKFGLNPDYLSRLFKARYYLTPHAYLIKQRLNKAKTILSGADRLNYSVKKVALLCGFNDPLYFSRLFKKTFNLSPSDYVLKFDLKPKKKQPLGSVVEDDL